MQIDVQALIDERGGNKQVFLDNVQQKINQYIAGKSWQDCLTIVQLNSDGTINSMWSPAASLDYAKRLVAFMHGKKYEEGGFFSSTKYYDLDSGLTKGVVDVVTEEFKKFYSAEEFSNLLFQQLMKDKVFAGELANTLADILNEASNGVLGSALKKQLSDQLAQSLLNAGGDTLATAIGTALKAVLGKVIGLVAATSISKAVLAVMMKNMVIMLKGVLAKVLATTALKTTLMTLLKKLVLAQIVAAAVAFITAMAAKAGISVSFGWIAAPVIVVIIGWIIKHEINNLPADMGKKVSKSVRDELDGKFARINNDVVTEMAKSLAKTAMSDLVGKIAGGLMENENFKKAVGDLK